MFDSVLGRGVGAKARPGFGAALSLGVHALFLAVALLVARPDSPGPLTIRPLHFPTRLPGQGGAAAPKAPVPVRQAPPTALKARLAPLQPSGPRQAPTAAPSGDPASGEVVAGPTGNGAPPGDVLCQTPPCDGPASGGEEAPQFLGPDMTPPRLLLGPEPNYPAAAQAQHIGGTVLVRCTVTVRGTVEDCSVLHSVPMLDQAVLRALALRTYSPALSEGRPISVRTVLPVHFVPAP